MAPKSPWHKKTIKNVEPPVAITAGENPVLLSESYDEIQEEEIEVLKAIYIDDFIETATKSAWNKTIERSFKLRLRSSSDADTHVILSTRLTSTYPKSLPLLEILNLSDYHERTQIRINGIIRDRPKQLIGEVMIHAIASEIQDAIEDAVQARQQGTLPSLEDERANAEETALLLAKEMKEADARRQQEDLQEEERVLKQMVDEEVNRRERKKAARIDAHASTDATPNSLGENVSFDQSSQLKTERDSWSFSSVTLLSPMAAQRDEQKFIGKPEVGQIALTPFVVIRQLSLRKSREEIMEMEACLEQVRRLRHHTLLAVHLFRLDKFGADTFRLYLCTDFSDRGSLADLLQSTRLNASRAKQFTTDLLEGLDFLHRNGVAHNNLHLESVLLHGSSPLSVRMADFALADSLCEYRDSLPQQWKTPGQPHAAAGPAKRKGDIWDLAILVCQMFISNRITLDYASPQDMIKRLDLSRSFHDLVHKMFTVDDRKRPSAFDILPMEFLRTDASAFDSDFLSEELNPRLKLDGHNSSPGFRQSRHDSTNTPEPHSRYVADFTEIGRLGKGGFGEVVKARNKLDGGLYAVKKIRQMQQLLDKVLSEVMLLNRLNHPYVVRYYSTWVEKDSERGVVDNLASSVTDTTETLDDEAESSDGPRMDFGYQSTGGLDFVSSSGYAQIEFGNDEVESDDDDDSIFERGSVDSDDGQTESEGRQAVRPSSRHFPESDRKHVEHGLPPLGRVRSDLRRTSAILYIQMEYCERQTLRDLVRRGMTTDDAWRFIRQITEGLAHVHSHGIIHRDLKPDNIFLDVAGNPKIGDFGLATTSQYQAVEKSLITSGASGVDMTRSVGTALYVAPELKSGVHGSYSEKVDMYSLGIIFYEMNEVFGTAMERIRALQIIREKSYQLPAIYGPDGEKEAQGKLITCLISHKPAERPTSTELLRSEILPMKIEDETIKKALGGLSDPRSPYHQKMMSALFSHDLANSTRVKALAWDANAGKVFEAPLRLRLRAIARQTLETVFTKHGAEEARRETIFPRSGHYQSTNVVQLLDASGNMLQLPYDLVLPLARQLAQQAPEVGKTFMFGYAYRDAFTGGPPRISEEVDFDIVNNRADDDCAFNDAEVIKVMDEIASSLPYFADATTTCFHLNHGTLLDAVLEYARVTDVQQTNVKEALSRLGFHQWTWPKMRTEMRKMGLTDTTLDDMSQFDFRETPERAFAKLRAIFTNASVQLQRRLEQAIQALNGVLDVLFKLPMQRKIYVTPLASVNAKFYGDGMLFQCVLERKAARTVIAAGGRYDSLIHAHRPLDGRVGASGAVGVSIGLDPIITHMGRNAGDGSKDIFLKTKASAKVGKTPKRCEVLVVANGSENLRSAGIGILNTLWINGIGAELATRGRNFEETLEHNFVVFVRHEASSTVRLKSAWSEAEESELPVTALVSHIQQEIRERETTKNRQPLVHRPNSHHDGDRKNNVQVLMSQHRSKKSNKYHIVEAAQSHWAEKLDGWKDAPILAVETRDDVMDLIRETRLGDGEGWRKAIQSVSVNERQYVQQIQGILENWRNDWQDGTAQREACIFNFRTGHCIYYDLGGRAL